MVDLFSKPMEAYPMLNQEAESIEMSLEHGWCRRHGYPVIVLSDQGKNLDRGRIREWCNRMGIEKRRSSPYHKEGNGQVERNVQTFKQTLRCILEDRHIEKINWPALLQEITFVCNGQPNSSTGYSPHQLMYGTPLRIPVNAWTYLEQKEDGQPDRAVYSQWVATRNSAFNDHAREYTELAQANIKRFYDRGKSHSDIILGDWVLIEYKARIDALEPMYKGSWLVLERKGLNLHVQCTKTGRKSVVHKLLDDAGFL